MNQKYRAMSDKESQLWIGPVIALVGALFVGLGSESFLTGAGAFLLVVALVIERHING